LELFPPTYLPFSISLNGLSSPQIGSTSQPYKHLKPIYSMPAQRHGSMAQHPKHLIYIQLQNWRWGMHLSSYLNACADMVGWLMWRDSPASTM
jgi:hypothetical protein